jgi:putative copper resistance protein D
MWLSELTRFLQFACVLSLFGIAAWLKVVPPAQEPSPRPGQSSGWPLAIYAAVGLLGAAATMGWLLAEARTIGGAWSAVGAVMASTRFGRVAVVRAGLLIVSALMVWTMRRSRGLWGVLSALTAAAVTSFVWTGHGTAGVGAAVSLHIIADALHLLCAALWIGALIMLSAGAVQACAAKSPRASAALLTALSQFSAVGPAVVGLLVATGLVNTWLLVGPGQWVGLLLRPYGWVLLAKLALFAGMLLLGRQHRYRTTPALRQALTSSVNDASVLRPLRRTLLAETLLAAGVLVAVAMLGNLEPPASLS